MHSNVTSMVKKTTLVILTRSKHVFNVFFFLRLAEITHELTKRGVGWGVFNECTKSDNKICACVCHFFFLIEVPGG
jgi:hypothetical protein